jgi:hypothetical protein
VQARVAPFAIRTGRHFEGPRPRSVFAVAVRRNLRPPTLPRASPGRNRANRRTEARLYNFGGGRGYVIRPGGRSLVAFHPRLGVTVNLFLRDPLGVAARLVRYPVQYGTYEFPFSGRVCTAVIWKSISKASFQCGILLCGIGVPLEEVAKC